MRNEFVDSLALRLVQAMLHFLWQGCAMALLAMLAGRLFRRASAHVRYVCHVAAMFAMVLCLPATFVLVDATPHDEITSMSGTTANAAASSKAGTSTPIAKGVSASAIPVGKSLTGATTSNEGRAATFGLPLSSLEPFAPYVMAGYFLGVALMTIRLAMAFRGVRSLCRSAFAVEDVRLLGLIDREVRRIGLKAAPAVAYCERISGPIVVGILKPTIFLPWAMASGLTPDQLQAILAHELAHIRRHDLLVNLFQRQAEALLFFHPAIWYISRRISEEREIATDEQVLAAGWARVHYANALVRMAELSSALRRESLARSTALAAEGSGVSELKRRVLNLVSPDDRPAPRLSRAGGILFLSVLILIALTPVLVQAWAPPKGSAPEEKAAQAPGADSRKNIPNPFHPRIVIAEHVILWDHHVVTWDQVVKRLRAKRAAGPFRATFYSTNGLIRSKKGERDYHDRIMGLYRELFEPVGVSFASATPRASAFFDAIRSTEDLNPDPRFVRDGQVLTPQGKPAQDAQVIVLPAEGPFTALGVALAGTRLRDSLDEQWMPTDEEGHFVAYPREAKYLLMILHPSGFLARPSTSTDKVFRLEPWATLSFQSTGEVADQQANVSIKPDGTDGDMPGVQIYSIQTKGNPVEVKVPAGKAGVSRSLAMGEGVSISLPAENFELQPGEVRTLEIKPPSDADRKRAKALYEELHGPRAKR